MDPLQILYNLPGYVYWKNTRGIWLGCNFEQARLLGFNNPKKVIGKSDFDLFTPDKASKRHEQDLDIIKKDQHVSIEETIMVNGKETSVMSYKSPLKNNKSTVVGLIVNSVNITELQNSNRNLAMALDGIISNLPGHVYWKDRKGRYLGCNDRQAQYFGLKDAKELINKVDSEFFEPEMYKKIHENDQYVMKTGSANIIEEPVIKNGHKYFFVSHKAPLKSKNGKVKGVIGVSIDITKQKDLEEKYSLKAQETVEALNVKKDFLGKVSHEIRTPLQGILGISAELSREWDKYSPEEQKANVDMIASNSARLMSYTKNILDIASYNSGKIQLILKKSVDLIELADLAISSAKSLISAENKDLAIELEIDPQTSYKVECDRTRILEIFYNLVSNAVKYSDEGKILVKLENNEREVKVSIIDRGVGVPDNEKIAIFEEFTQSSRTVCSYKGTGLGLAICKEIVVLHRGNIWVEDNESVGSIFVFTIPYEQTTTFQPIKRADPNKKIKVLIVDDEKACLWALSMILTNCGCDPVLAEDGVKALEYLAEHHKDVELILLDMMMPRMHGLEVLKHLKENPDFQSIPVVIHTGLPDSNETREALSLGAIEIIAKPYDKGRVEELIKRIYSD